MKKAPGLSEGSSPSAEDKKRAAHASVFLAHSAPLIRVSWMARYHYSTVFLQSNNFILPHTFIIFPRAGFRSVSDERRFSAVFTPNG